MAELGQIPADAARKIRERGGAAMAAFGTAEVAAIEAIEAETRHDVIAFLTWLGEAVGPEARFLHLGLTSSDVLDTCLSLQLTQATDLLLAETDHVLAALKDAGDGAPAHASRSAAATASMRSRPASG